MWYDFDGLFKTLFWLCLFACCLAVSGGVLIGHYLW